MSDSVQAGPTPFRKVANKEVQRRDKPRISDVDPKIAFIHAENYFAASEILMDYMLHDNTRRVNVANVVLLTFAAECFLKCLLFLDKGSFPQRHELVELFDELDPENRKRLEEYNEDFCSTIAIAAQRKANTPHIKYDIRSLLNDSSTSFIDTRYMWEKAHKSVPAVFGWGMDTVLLSLRKRILDLKPDWRELVPSDP